MSEKLSNDTVEGNQKGKRKMPNLKNPSLIKSLIIALLGVLILSTIPLLPQTRISVTTDRDVIKNVIVETPRVPLVISLFPSPSVGKGAYTIKVEVFQNGILLFNSTLQDVPSGDFTFIWLSNGTPKSGTYHVTVQLLRAGMEVNSFSLDVDF